MLNTPFSLNNKQQMAALHHRLNRFEYDLNKMYLYQSSMPLFLTSSFLFTIANHLPFTGLIVPLFSLACYLGFIGMGLMYYSKEAFVQHWQDLQKIYNWVMKNGDLSYSPLMNNEEKLKNKDIQRLILLLAPISSIEFMVAWPKTSKDTTQTETWLITSLAQQTIRFFSANPSNEDESKYIEELKKKVETGEMQLGRIDGLKQARQYFTGADFRKMAQEESFAFIKEYLYKMKGIFIKDIQENFNQRITC